MQPSDDIREARTRQGEYWGANLDPDNQGGAQKGKTNFEAELPYYLIPDQTDALADMGDLRGKRLLEVGAGVGMNARWCAASGADVVAIDIAHERLQMLRELPPGNVPNATGKHGKLLCVKAKAEALPFRRDAFDLEYVKAVLIHTELAQAAREMNRVLAQDGTAVICEPMDANPIANLYRKTFAPRIWQSITVYFSPAEIATVRGAFADVRERRYYLTAFAAFTFQFALRVPLLFRVSLFVCGAFDKFVLLICPPLRRFAWFVSLTARKRSE